MAIGGDGTIYAGSRPGSSNGKVYALNSNGSKKWETVTGPYNWSPAIGANSIIYVCSNQTQYLWALDEATGEKKWEFRASNTPCSSPTIGNEGIVYFSALSKVYALDGKTGSKIWEFSGSGQGFETPSSIGPDGTVYVGAMGGLYALNGKTGAKKWKFETIADNTVPAIGNDGIIYLGCGDGKVYALDE